MVTNEPGFREHLTNFALHQLVLLFFQTLEIVDDLEKAGIGVAEDIESGELDAMVQRIAALGQVPLR
jgi:hypothetical protein